MMREPKKDEKKVIDGTAAGKLRRAVDVVLRTEEGRVLWAELFHRCGYNRSSIRLSRTTGDVAHLSTEMAEAQRLLYLDLRRLASPELLAVAEQQAEAIALTPEPKEDKPT